MSMKIHGAKIQNMQQVGGQGSMVRRKDLKTTQDNNDGTIQEDQISLSDQAKNGRKAGEVTGMAGHEGSRHTKKEAEIKKEEAEIQDNFEHSTEEAEEPQISPQQRFAFHQSKVDNAGSELGKAIEQQSPENKKAIENIMKQVNAFADNQEMQTGQKIDRTAIYAQVIANDPQLSKDPQLNKTANNYVEATSNRDADAVQLAQQSGAMPQGHPGSIPMGQQGMPYGAHAMNTAGSGGAPPPPPEGGSSPADGPQKPPTQTELAQKQQAAQSDMQEARTIYMQMAADRQKWMARIWQILQDTQTEIMKIMQEVTVKRAATMDALAQKWSAVISG